ncbi:MAG TPA: DNA primase, partial [Ktedonobacterales bacterium]|nr:DNA primase [Ktedonobacterales bacterium]
MATEATSVIERIKQKLDIVEEIGAVVSLKKSGKAFKGLCPFHGERTPSFYVFPDKQDWHCFGCGERGDLITFVQKQQSLDFREALELLAERAGIPLESGGRPESAEEAAETSARKRMRALNEAAAIWFHHQLLQSTSAQYCRSYLDSRGVSNDSIAHWRLGYAPDGDALAQYLLSVGYSEKELVEAGLAREREANRGGGLYAYFRNRLIFPIRDARGQTIAFGARALDGSNPKYLNTQQTLLFDKSATLYGLDLARDAIRRGNRIVIVEGYMDAVVTHQYGTRNVVACIGSAITEKHIRQIKKLTRRVTLALDPDSAGESATLRGITVAQQAFDRVVVPVPGPAPDNLRAQQEGWATHSGKRGAPRRIVRFEEQVDAEITVAKLPPHEDPDEFARRDPAGWQQAIEKSLPLIEYLIEAQTADLALDTPQGKLEASRRLLPIL